MSNYDKPDAADVRQALYEGLSAVPLVDFSIVQYDHADYSTEAFALVRDDGTVWIVSVQPGKLVLSR